MQQQFKFSQKHQKFVEDYKNQFDWFYDPHNRQPTLDSCPLLHEFDNLVKYAMEEFLALAAGIVSPVKFAADQRSLDASTTPLLTAITVLEGGGNIKVAGRSCNLQSRSWTIYADKAPNTEQQRKLLEIKMFSDTLPQDCRPQSHVTAHTITLSAERTLQQNQRYRDVTAEACNAIVHKGLTDKLTNDSLPTDLIQMAMQDLIWLAASKDHRAQNNNVVIGPTRALALVYELINKYAPAAWEGAISNPWLDHYDKLRELATAMGRMVNATPEESQRIAKDTLHALYPNSAKAQRGAKVDVAATSFFAEMRNTSNASTKSNKYEVMKANISAAAVIMGERAQANGLQFASDDERKAFVNNLAECMNAELGKNPYELYKELGGSAGWEKLPDHLAAGLSPRLQQNWVTYTGQDANWNGLYYGLSGSINNLRNAGVRENFTGAEFNSIFEIEVFIRKKLIQDCKTLLQNKRKGNAPFTKEQINKCELAILEQESIVAAMEVYSNDKNTQMYLAAALTGLFGGILGLILGVGGTAGVGTAASETFRQALDDLLLHGSVKKFVDGLTANNPILIITILAGVIGAVGLFGGLIVTGQAGGRLGGGAETLDIINKQCDKAILEHVTSAKPQVAQL
ncbi:MAG: hypothetical protein JSS50_01985 [Proteobacteria bacterium]|nr:hypothetical protein [Pseudomonadota bacterium]